MTREPDLVDRSEDSIGRLFDRHAGAVFRLAFALLRDADDAQDVVQETFVLAWRKRRSIVLVDGSALPWLLASARLIALATRRRGARRRTTAVPDEQLHAIAAVQTGDELAVREALAGLPRTDREVVTLVLVEGLSYAEAAANLGLSPAATGKRLQRARARLRDDLRPSPTAERTAP